MGKLFEELKRRRVIESECAIKFADADKQVREHRLPPTPPSQQLSTGDPPPHSARRVRVPLQSRQTLQRVG